jgi:hypothetical protein
MDGPDGRDRKNNGKMEPTMALPVLVAPIFYAQFLTDTRVQLG